jgi:hypothetical protein
MHNQLRHDRTLYRHGRIRLRALPGGAGFSSEVFKNPLRSRPSVISKEAPHHTIGSHERLRAD